MGLGNDNANKCKQFAFDLNVPAVDDASYNSRDKSPLCSICLKFLISNNDERRTLVTLKCDHKFHFDCLGTTFNASGLMQCPKCQQIEPGQWRYATSLPNSDLIDEEDDETMPEYPIDMTTEVELCPIKVLPRQNSFGNTNSVDQVIFSDEPLEHIGSQECVYMEYTFTIPQSSSAAEKAQNFSSQLRTDAEQFPNRRIFWSVQEPGVIRGRHYIEHPFLDHGRIPESLPNSFGSNQDDDDGADPYMELAEQFQMEGDELYNMIAGNENGDQGESIMNGGSSGGGQN